MRLALEQGDRLEWAAMDERFHRCLVEQCGNERIRRVVFNVWDQSHRARMLAAPLRPIPTESTRNTAPCWKRPSAAMTAWLTSCTARIAIAAWSKSSGCSSVIRSDIFRQ